MRTIGYRNYLDKVYGCWIGKCVGGTIGAPFEGAKELFDFEYDPAVAANMLPNDDLDLQVLWLAVLEEKGVHFTSDDLAEAFFTKCPYAPGEYAIFKKNYARGLRPPVTGWYNNRYYIEGMGCPIRAELWGCIAPGNPALAADLAAKDGVLDHAGNSVYAEQFLSGVVSAAFFESDLDKLIETGLSLIPPDSRMANLIRDTRDWCRASSDWRFVRGQVIREYGHPDCTNSFQNIGYTLLSLLLGEGDFIRTQMIALNCGFDTDCTCGIAAAIQGIILGGARLAETHGFGDPGFKLGVRIQRRSDRVLDLAEDTCLMGLHFAEQLNKQTVIASAPAPPSIEIPAREPIGVSVEYDGVPCVGIGDTKRVTLRFENQTDGPFSGKVAVTVPDGWRCEPASAEIAVAAGGSALLGIEVSVPGDVAVLNETNICEARIEIAGREPFIHRFGLVGASVWKVFGPFWQNVVEMPPLKITDSYYAHISGGTKDEYADCGRCYHLNTRVDPHRGYMTPDEIAGGSADGDAAKEGMLVNCYEDLISVGELVGFQGPCAVYAVRRMISPEDRTLALLIGHTDAFALWVNGKLVAERENVDWWTAENVHIHEFPIRAGENEIVVKLIRRGRDAEFSLVFTKSGTCSEHFSDFASVNPQLPGRR